MAERILIVEDEFLIARAISKGLERHGFEICGLASQGQEAIDKARELAPDFVLMDVCLAGEIDGVEAARTITEQKTSRVIFLTGYPKADVEQRAEGVDYLAIFTKPVRILEIVKLVGQPRQASSAN